MNLFNDKDFNADFQNRMNKMRKNVVKTMWPVILLNLFIVLSLLGGAVWLLLYILDTYVGKA